MPYPPPKPRKLPHLPPNEARTKHLAPYQFKPGQSANPGGISKSQRELYAEVRDLSRKAAPGAIRRLMQLAGLSETGQEEPHCEIDPRVTYMAAQFLVERAWGKAKEYDPDSERSREIPDTTKLSPEERAAMREAAEKVQGLAALAQDRAAAAAERIAAERAVADRPRLPQADRAGGVVIEGSATLAEADGAGE